MASLDGGYDDMRRAYDRKLHTCYVIKVDRPGLEHPFFVQGLDSEGGVVWGPSHSAAHFDTEESATEALLACYELNTDPDVKVDESYFLSHLSRGFVSALPEVEPF